MNTNKTTTEVPEMLGGILTGAMIRSEVANGHIAISDFNEKQLNPNSYNLRIGSKVATIAPTGYVEYWGSPEPDKYGVVNSIMMKRERPIWELDIKKPIELEVHDIPADGMVLQPHQLYLISTEERIECGSYVPIITGRSSMGRMGIEVHREAGFGDIGYEGCFTLQMDVSLPTRIYPYAEMAQVYFITPCGPIEKKYTGKYQGSTDIAASRSYIDFSNN